MQPVHLDRLQARRLPRVRALGPSVLTLTTQSDAALSRRVLCFRIPISLLVPYVHARTPPLVEPRFCGRSHEILRDNGVVAPSWRFLRSRSPLDARGGR